MQIYDANQHFEKVCKFLNCKTDDISRFTNRNITMVIKYVLSKAEKCLNIKPQNINLMGDVYCYNIDGIKICWVNQPLQNNIGTYFCKKSDAARFVWNAYQFSKTSHKIPCLKDSEYKNIILDTERYIKNIKILNKNNIKMPRGILLIGPPGNGKSLICKYFYDKYNAFYLNASNISSFVNGNLVLNHTSVIIMDDLDFASISLRKDDGSNALLSIIDGVNKKNQVYILTTNTVGKNHNISPEFIRPGRFSNIFYLDNPDEFLKRKLINTWKLKTSLDIENIINKTEGYSFADMDNIRTQVFLKELNNEQVDIDEILKIKSNNEKVNKRIGF